MICIYKNLKFLANSLQPMILKPFFTTSLKMAIDSFENRKDRAFLDQIVVRLTEVLKNPSILDINKTTISEVLCDQLYSTNTNSPVSGHSYNSNKTLICFLFRFLTFS